MYKLIAAVLIVMGCCTLYALWDLGYTSYKLDRALAKAETDCVKQLVQVYERIDIATGKGTCWYEENGYYNHAK